MILEVLQAYTVESTTFWLAVSTVIFMVLLWRYGRNPILTTLDTRSEKIRQQIADSEALKQEAQDLLARYQQKHRDAIREADEILAAAQKKAEAARIKAEKDLKETIDRYERQSLSRIQRFEKQAVRELKEEIVNIAIDTVEKQLEDSLTEDQRAALTEKSMARAKAFFENDEKAAVKSQ